MHARAVFQCSLPVSGYGLMHHGFASLDNQATLFVRVSDFDNSSGRARIEGTLCLHGRFPADRLVVLEADEIKLPVTGTFDWQAGIVDLVLPLETDVPWMWLTDENHRPFCPLH